MEKEQGPKKRSGRRRGPYSKSLLDSMSSEPLQSRASASGLQIEVEHGQDTSTAIVQQHDLEHVSISFIFMLDIHIWTCHFVSVVLDERVHRI